MAQAKGACMSLGLGLRLGLGVRRGLPGSRRGSPRAFRGTYRKRAPRLASLRSLAVGIAILLAFAGTIAADDPLWVLDWTETRAQSTTHLLIISGLGGEKAYSDLFHEWALDLAGAAEERYGVPAESVTLLTEAPERAPGRIDGRSSKEEIEKAFAGIAAGTAAGDAVIVVLIGHGSF
ncbi:MAG: hypothetical protein ACRELX_04170, partial [Longimicrobiales bacterium]